MFPSPVEKESDGIDRGPENRCDLLVPVAIHIKQGDRSRFPGGKLRDAPGKPFTFELPVERLFKIPLFIDDVLHVHRPDEGDGAVLSPAHEACYRIDRNSVYPGSQRTLTSKPGKRTVDAHECLLHSFGRQVGVAERAESLAVQPRSKFLCY